MKQKKGAIERDVERVVGEVRTEPGNSLKRTPRMSRGKQTLPRKRWPLEPNIVENSKKMQTGKERATDFKVLMTCNSSVECRRQEPGFRSFRQCV